MGTLRTRKRCRSDTGSGLPRLHLDLHALVVKQLYTRPPMSSSTPVLPEERRIPNDKRMEQDAHLARLARFAPLPLARLSQRAGTATANAGSIHDAQTAIGFSALFLRSESAPCWTAKRSIELQGKV
jgi:hypothetical protein